jgi:HD-like signal output (HDOD) protein
MPEVASRILALNEHDSAYSFEQLEKIVKIDPGLTAKILKVANSALYARPKEIDSLQTAIGLLGFKNIRSMVVLVTASTMVQASGNHKVLKVLWNEAVRAAFYSRFLAIRTGNRDIAEEVFTAAVLQDIGKLAFAVSDTTTYNDMISRSHTVSSLPDQTILTEETTEFGMNHRDLGAMILESWKFPDQYIEVCRDHGSKNIPLRYRKLLSLISLGTALSQIPSNKPLNEEAIDFMKTFLRNLGLSEDELDPFRQKTEAELDKDRLFNECREMIA